MERLLPCPFCGHSAFLESNDNKGDIVYRIRCSNIGCDTRPSTEKFRSLGCNTKLSTMAFVSLTKATEIWNTRNNESYPSSF